MQKTMIIEDPTVEEGFEGMILGTPELEDDYTPVPFDLHAAAKYVREKGLPGIDETIIQMFANNK